MREQDYGVPATVGGQFVALNYNIGGPGTTRYEEILAEFIKELQTRWPEVVTIAAGYELGPTVLDTLQKQQIDAFKVTLLGWSKTDPFKTKKETMANVVIEVDKAIASALQQVKAFPPKSKTPDEPPSFVLAQDDVAKWQYVGNKRYTDAIDPIIAELVKSGDKVAVLIANGQREDSLNRINAKIESYVGVSIPVPQGTQPESVFQILLFNFVDAEISSFKVVSGGGVVDPQKPTESLDRYQDHSGVLRTYMREELGLRENCPQDIAFYRQQLETIMTNRYQGSLRPRWQMKLEKEITKLDSAFNELSIKASADYDAEAPSNCAQPGRPPGEKLVVLVDQVANRAMDDLVSKAEGLLQERLAHWQECAEASRELEQIAGNLKLGNLTCAQANAQRQKVTPADADIPGWGELCQEAFGIGIEILFEDIDQLCGITGQGQQGS